jgi:phage terminase large subunit
VQRAFGTCDALGSSSFQYDADGLGAGVRGDARVINEQRREAGQGVRAG